MTKHDTKHRHSHSDFDISGDIGKLKDILTNTALHVKNRATGALSESVDNVKERSLELQDNVKDYIAERPIQAVSVAMVSGVLLGYWMNGKRKSSHRR